MAMLRRFFSSSLTGIRKRICKWARPNLNVLNLNGQFVLVSDLARRMDYEQGGEAQVFDVSQFFNTPTMLKLWIPPDHPELLDLGEEGRSKRELAAARIARHQTKMPSFPTKLPAHVAAPRELIRPWPPQLGYFAKRLCGPDEALPIVGFTMDRIDATAALSRYGKRSFRKTQNITAADVTKLLLKLHQLVTELHELDVVIGDFTDSNVLVKDSEVWIVDTDSMQFGDFLCRSFTPNFVDPRICELKNGELRLKDRAIHSKETDWYAFAVMAFTCLTYSHPYGGIYKSLPNGMTLKYEDRLLQRISVFDPNVAYSGNGLPLTGLPPELVAYFRDVFSEVDRRGIFPKELLEGLCWKKCRLCGEEFAHGKCPSCLNNISSRFAFLTAGDEVADELVFEADDRIIAAATVKNSLQWISVKDGMLVRNDGLIIPAEGQVIDNLKLLRISGDQTVLGGQNIFRVYKGNARVGLETTDSVDSRPLVDANESAIVFVQNNKLYRYEEANPAHLIHTFPGPVTYLKLGPKFGIVGLVDPAERKLRLYCFNPFATGIRRIKLKLPTNVVPFLSCSFTAERCWIICGREAGIHSFNKGVVIDETGDVRATIPDRLLRQECFAADWLSRTAATFVPSHNDRRVHALVMSVGKSVRCYSERNKTVVQTGDFASNCAAIHQPHRLYFSDQGIMVVTVNQIHQLFPV